MKRPRLTAAIVTVAFHALVVALLLVLYLRFSPDELAERTWPPVEDDEILYGGEYVMLGDDPQAPADAVDDGMPAAESNAEESHDLANSGAAAEAAPRQMTSERESPVKVKKDTEEPRPSGPSKEELERQRQQRREREASERINSRVKFGTGTGDGESSKKPGSPNGNAAHGALSGAPGTDLHGRTLASWSKPSGTATGTIVIRVHVNRKGKVTSAGYQSGTGAIAGNAAARRSCEQAAMRSAFSVSDNAPVDQIGTITYRFE